MLKYILSNFFRRQKYMAKDKVKKEKAKKEPTEPKPEKAAKKKGSAEINPIAKLEKAEKVELQNFLFGTTEKKIMVSDDFLYEMTMKYISKRMKIINTAFSNLHITRSAVFFFKNTAEIEKLIEDLIILEKYYPFKNPVPSIYKRNYFAHKPAAITGMINRIIKSALQKFPLKEGTPPEDIDPKAMEYYDSIIEEMLSQKDNYSEQDMEMINSFFIRVHGEQTEELAEPIETSETDEENVSPDEGTDESFNLNLDGEET